MTEADLRELLIESCHSSVDAEQRILAQLNSAEFVSMLVRVAVDAQDHGGDAPMQSAYFLSQAAPPLLQVHEAELLALLETADGYAGSVALALGRLRSPAAKPIIERRIEERWWPEPLYREALACYEA